MPQELSGKIAALLNAAPGRLRVLQGGSLSSVYRLELTDGRTAVAKQGDSAAREAHMLERMAATGASVPAVLAVEDDLLVMEDLGPGRPLASGDAAGWRALAQVLALLHAGSATQYGWDTDHAFGPVSIENAPAATWPQFWAERRLLSLAAGLPAELADRLERLANRLDDRLPERPDAALLHGDLWTGNVYLPNSGGMFLIDPACYYGDRRVDLAMLSLFAVPPADFEETTIGGDPDWPEIRAVYQLWPALVHLRLFGAAYLGHVTDRLDILGV